MTDNSTLRVQDISQLRFQPNSMSFCMVVLNRTMRRVTHCTSLEVLAFSGLQLHCEDQRVVINNKIAVHVDLSCGGNTISLGASFAGLLDRFCGCNVGKTDIDKMRQFAQFWNSDVAECSRFAVELPIGIEVTFAVSSPSASSVPVTPPLSSSSQPSSSSGLQVPTPPPAPTLPFSLFVPFEGGKHLCQQHRPTNKDRRSMLKYWFYQAAIQGCTRCVEFCVRRHGID